ncbi:MAG: hypothetical protein PHG25_04120 [Candidatus Pacebacteria bacterium]|nr:hypothetical protein [Candidatus Paceibacterota bacterium]
MLREKFPGKLPMEPAFKQVAVKHATLIVGPPSCGKTKMRETLTAASVYIGGYVSEDSSAIIDWHCDPENNSPFYEETITADKIRKSGGLVDNQLICRLLQYWLMIKEVELMHQHEISVQRLDLSGFPRTREQYEAMFKFFNRVSIFAIDLSEEEANENRLKRIEQAHGAVRDDDKPDRFKKRWTDYRELTEPFIKWGLSQGIITPISFSAKHLEKVLKVTRRAHYTEYEQKSVQRQLLNEKCDAHWLAQQFDDPDNYKSHMDKQLKLHQAQQPAPQINLANQYFFEQTQRVRISV